MTLGALEPQPQKKLGRIFQLRIRSFHLAVPRNGRVLADVARGSQNFPDKLIVRFVLLQTVTQPIVKGKGPAGMGAIAALVAKQRAPLVSEIIGIFRTIDEGIDPMVPFGRVLVCEESFCFFRRRQPSGNVERGAADKSGIIADLRRRHADFFQFFEDQLVNEIFCHRHIFDGRSERENGLEHRHARLVTDHH